MAPLNSEPPDADTTKYEAELVLYTEGVEPIAQIVDRINHYLAISRDRYMRHPHRFKPRATASVRLRYGHADD